jgi:hypothetical protein
MDARYFEDTGTYGLRIFQDPPDCQFTVRGELTSTWFTRTPLKSNMGLSGWYANVLVQDKAGWRQLLEIVAPGTDLKTGLASRQAHDST